MGRASVPVAIAAALTVSACVPRNATWGPPSLASRPATTQVQARALTPAERRVRELEQQLAERDREIAAVRKELAATGAAPDGTTGAAGAAVAAPVAAGAVAAQPTSPAPPAA